MDVLVDRLERAKQAAREDYERTKDGKNIRRTARLRSLLEAMDNFLASEKGERSW